MQAGTKAFAVALCLSSLVSLAGCDKSACELGQIQPVTFPWDKHQDLVPAGAKVCGVDKGEPSALRLSFPDDHNPFVTTILHLEDKHGWSRVKQDTKDKNFLTARLEKDNLELIVWARRDRGYHPHVEMRLSDPDCTRSPAKDGSACRGEQVIKCKEGVLVAEGPKCDRTAEVCRSSAGFGSGGQGETARCEKRPN